jgi:hypothetical protein
MGFCVSCVGAVARTRVLCLGLRQRICTRASTGENRNPQPDGIDDQNQIPMSFSLSYIKQRQGLNMDLQSYQPSFSLKFDVSACSHGGRLSVK